LDNPNNSKVNSAADVESYIAQVNGIEDLECIEQWGVHAAPNVLGLIRPTQKLKRQAENVLVMVNAMEPWRNRGIKKKLHRMRQCSTSLFM